MKKFYEQGIEALELINGQKENLGYDPTGLVIYDENGEILGFQDYDNIMFYPANIVEKVSSEGRIWQTLKEFKNDCYFDYSNELNCSALYIKEI